MPARVLVCLLLSAGLVAAGCGDDESSSESEQAATGEAQTQSTDEVEIVEFEFAPPEISVEAGTEVTWTNGDKAAHTATADDGSFDTETLDRGDSKAISFDEPGSYPYFCAFHAFMNGTIEVN